MQEIAEALYPVWIVLFMAVFIIIVAWAFWPSRRQKDRMKNHAEIPFREEDGDGQPS